MILEAPINPYVGPVLGLLGTVLSIWASLIAHNVRNEMQVKLVQPQLDAYRKLWSLMAIASPAMPERLKDKNNRVRLEEQLRSWYYTDGNGIFLSKKSRAIFVEAKDLLKDSSDAEVETITKKLSKLRSQLKNDIGVYGKEDLTPQKI